MLVSADTMCFWPIPGVSVKAPIQENFADTFLALVSIETEMFRLSVVLYDQDIMKKR